MPARGLRRCVGPGPGRTIRVQSPAVFNQRNFSVIISGKVFRSRRCRAMPAMSAIRSAANDHQGKIVNARYPAGKVLYGANN